MLCVLALNLVRSFQSQTGAPVRLRSRKGTLLHRLQSRLRLQIAAAPPVRRRFQKALARLPDAA